MTWKVNLVLEFHIFSSTRAPCVLASLPWPRCSTMNSFNSWMCCPVFWLIDKIVYGTEWITQLVDVDTEINVVNEFYKFKRLLLLRCAVWVAILHSHMRSFSHRSINRLLMVIGCFCCNWISLNELEVDEYSTRGLYHPGNVLRLYRKNPHQWN